MVIAPYKSSLRTFALEEMFSAPTKTQGKLKYLGVQKTFSGYPLFQFALSWELNDTLSRA